MGLKDTGKVNEEATAGAGRGKPISRDAGDTGPVNPNATKGAGRGYEPIRLGARAMAERVSYNETEVVIRKRVDPVVGGGASIEGNFYTRYRDPDGNLMLKGGHIWAGDGSETIVPFELMAAPLGDADPVWAGTAGQHLVLTVTGTAEAADDVLLPQFNMSAGSLAVASDVGDPTLPTVDSLSGTFKTSLGVFGENSFSPNLPGNYGIGFCFSGFTISRG